jgi:peptidoglycan/xylan/chitin deacetylase (PgdA/CDA1 family)
MHKYLLKIPWWLRKMYPAYTWRVPVTDNSVFLTFDDGPHPKITPWVLRQLALYGAKATFFCIGRNVETHPEIYKQILAEGHTVGNHTYTHLNGWRTPIKEYLEDVKKGSELTGSLLFRPPYGRIKKRQAKEILQASAAIGCTKIVMWDVLSADFDSAISPEACAEIVLKRVEPGSVIVFHDSEKAFKNLEYALPVVLDKLSKGGYLFKRLEDRP